MMNPQCPDNGKLLDLPPKNTLLPKDFDLIEASQENTALLKEWDESELWFKSDH
jgi:hypothetical protein